MFIYWIEVESFDSLMKWNSTKPEIKFTNKNGAKSEYRKLFEYFSILYFVFVNFKAFLCAFFPVVDFQQQPQH